jgi:hypothetical protein
VMQMKPSSTLSNLINLRLGGELRLSKFYLRGGLRLLRTPVLIAGRQFWTRLPYDIRRCRLPEQTFAIDFG